MPISAWIFFLITLLSFHVLCQIQAWTQPTDNFIKHATEKQQKSDQQFYFKTLKKIAAQKYEQLFQNSLD